ncbi:hypothetical protein ACFL42_00210 [Candidatus Omnitrophota bacterium]
MAYKRKVVSILCISLISLLLLGPARVFGGIEEADQGIDGIGSEMGGLGADEGANAGIVDRVSSNVDLNTGIASMVKVRADGSRAVTKTDSDGNLVSMEVFPKGSNIPTITKYTDPDTRITTTTIMNEDGSKTVHKVNEIGMTVSKDTIPAPAPKVRMPASATSIDPVTGMRTTSSRNPDGSKTIVVTGKDGNLLSEKISR